jgi:hypothetical protein
MDRVRWAALSAFFVSCLQSQTLNVYSEFVRFNSRGEVTAPENPREILSPAMVRNGFTSFQILVEAKPGENYTLYVGLSPQDVVKVTMYRESGDRPQPVDLPFRGQGTSVFWMDVWCDRAVPVQRVKIEPELYVAGDWVRYPMEARVMEAVVPEAGRTAFPDARELLCGPARHYYSYLNVPDTTRFHERNRTQDAALASRVPKDAVVQAVGDCYSIDWNNPEAYLRIRDYLFRLR